MAIVVALAMLSGGPLAASELVGPARFCGYSPVIDLRAGERVVTGEGGIHGGSFRWEGPFGRLEVEGIGWAGRPKGRVAVARTPGGAVRFRERRVHGQSVVAIWNGRQGAAYFSSDQALTAAQLAAIDRVALTQEGEEVSGCKLRTVFSWE